MNWHSFVFALALVTSPIWAQQYPGGMHRFKSAQGELVVSSGFVTNLNVHTFNVYSFLFKPVNSEVGWQQVPIVERDDGSDMKFTMTTANTADFTLRDARVAVVGGSFELRVAQKVYKESPYDERTSIQVRRYVLVETDDEKRWVFQHASTQNAGRAETIEQVLSPPRGPRAKIK